MKFATGDNNNNESDLSIIHILGEIKDELFQPILTLLSCRSSSQTAMVSKTAKLYYDI